MDFDPILSARREMKRKFAGGDFDGALAIAERLLRDDPDDPLAEAIAVESRAEIDKRLFSDPVPPSLVADDIEVEVDIPADGDLDHETEAVTARGQNPQKNAQASAMLDDLDAAWDDDVPAAAESSSSPNAVTLPPHAGSASASGPAFADLTGIDAFEDDERTPPAQASPLASDPMARQMYEHFVASEFRQAKDLAERVLLSRPSDALALAVLSQSQVALGREHAIVVLVVSRQSLQSRSYDAKVAALLSRIDGRATVADLARACDLPVSDTLSTLEDLRNDGLVVFSTDEP